MSRYSKKRIGDEVYHTKEWRELRKYYHDKMFGLCERCGEPGGVVHHIIPITNENKNDPMITLSEENLELLCHLCHNKTHKQTENVIENGFGFDENGNFVKLDN